MAKNLMIRMAFLFMVLISLTARPACAANWWPFGGKKQEKQEKPAPPGDVPIYVKPKGEGKWALDGLLNLSKVQEKVIINGVEIKGLTPAMLGASYSPKTVEELKLVALAKNAWQIDSIKKSREASQARIAAAKKKSDAALELMKKRGAENYARAKVAEAADLAQKPGIQPAAGTMQQQPEAKPKPVIFNQKKLEAPSKVFKDFR